MNKIDLIAAARPNFMKVAPLYHALKKEPWCAVRVVHTGQHYDANMSDAFFKDLGLNDPDVHLGVGSGTHAEQTGGVMIAYEKECLRARPDWTVVVGDVNSTIACTLAAKKLGIAVAHLEAGLRSRDWTMPEEVNRVATDAVADLLLTPSADANENLAHEGVASERIDLVGNIMIDSLEMMRGSIHSRHYFRKLGLEPGSYGVATLHRPSNVDDPENLRSLVLALIESARSLPIVFPVHPRTRQRLQAAGLMDELSRMKNIAITDPLGYRDFMSLVFACKYVLTDSGGLQEETTYLGIPCITVRDNTERPLTVTLGTNELAKPQQVGALLERILAGTWKKGQVPTYWDGRTAARVVSSLKQRQR